MNNKQQKLLVDIGSSSVKFYLLDHDELKSLGVKSLPLKNDFTPEQGLSIVNSEDLFTSISEIHSEHSDAEIHIYATALFRKMSPVAQAFFKEKFKQKFGGDLTIISAEEENTYLEKAMVGKYNAPDPILLINIGGGSTELVVIKDGLVNETENIQQGVGSIMTHHPDINNSLTDNEYKNIKNKIMGELPDLSSVLDRCICTGGELTYMQRAGYPLEDNTLFSDSDHPKMIGVKPWVLHNRSIIRLPMHELEKIMPENATWMHGTRAFLSFLEAICEKYQIKVIVPSDANLMNGIVRAHFNS